jgi:phage-related tail protein
MQREADAWGDTLNARIEKAQNAFSNLSSDLGRHLKPAIADTLDKTLSIIQAVRTWADENPRLSKGLIEASKWLAIALSVIGGIALAAGAILVPLAAFKFSMVTLGLSGAGAFGMVTGAIKLMGRALLTNPIGLTMTSIATAAILIYENWDRIGNWFNGMIDGILARIARLKENLRIMSGGLVFGATGQTGNAPSPISASPLLPRIAGNSTYNINVATQPGADNADLARQIRNEMDRMDRDKAARARGRLRDQE